jgi:hypothetical protein
VKNNPKETKRQESTGMFWQSVEELEAIKKEHLEKPPGLVIVTNARAQNTNQVAVPCAIHQNQNPDVDPNTEVEFEGTWELVASRKTKQKKKKANKEKTKHCLNILGVVEPKGVMAITQGTWEEIEMAVDSGAGETVVGEDMLETIQTEEGEAMRRGVQYEIADGTLIPNQGEKNCVAHSEGGMMRRFSVLSLS